MVKVAYVHVLPLEYYPPARNLLGIMAAQPAWRVRAWSSENRRGQPPARIPGVEISRPAQSARGIMPVRVLRLLTWHIRTALELAAWRPDAVMYVEPHSAPAAWIYYRILRGTAALFIHHHEYYAPEDYRRRGMRLLRRSLVLEQRYLFPRAAWISQTNQPRLDLLLQWNRSIRPEAAKVLPNYPLRRFVEIAASAGAKPASAMTRLIYVGSASFEDTFIREAANLVMRHPDRVTLHVAGNNIQSDVWEWLGSLNAVNITTDPAGADYEELPRLLSDYDVGLVLYRGNTLNFVHNVTNKAIEYLAAGLEVWYPPVMSGIRRFHEAHPTERLVAMDFADPALAPPATRVRRLSRAGFSFTAETAAAPLLEKLATLCK